MTARQVAAAYGVTVRTVRNWARRGLSAVGTATDGAKLYAAADVARFAGRDPVPTPRRAPARSPVRRTSEQAEEVDLPSDSALPDPSALADDLLSTMTRLQQAERSTHDEWQRTRRTQGAAPAAVKAAREAWRDTADALRRWEKELPEILARKNQYVDVALVGQLLTAAVSAMTAGLDALGPDVGLRVGGTVAPAVRAAVEESVARIRQDMQAAVTRIMEDACHQP